MKEKVNIVTKFREFWKSLSSQEQKALWDILTALRDNDVRDIEGSIEVKGATTARIRGELLGVPYSFLPAVIHPSYKRWKSSFYFTSYKKIKRLFVTQVLLDTQTIIYYL